MGRQSTRGLVPARGGDRRSRIAPLEAARRLRNATSANRHCAGGDVHQTTIGSVGSFCEAGDAVLWQTPLAFAAAWRRCVQRDRTSRDLKGFTSCPVASGAELTFNHSMTLVPRG